MPRFCPGRSTSTTAIVATSQTSIGEARRNWHSARRRPNGPYADNQFSSEIGDHLALHGCLLEVENAGQSFGGAVQPTFIQEKIHEKQDLGTEQFADLLLNEVLAWSRNGTSRGRKTISQCGSLIFMGCGLELKGKSSFRSLSVARSH
jgi:hypothetical protein